MKTKNKKNLPDKIKFSSKQAFKIFVVLI